MRKTSDETGTHYFGSVSCADNQGTPIMPKSGRTVEEAPAGGDRKVGPAMSGRFLPVLQLSLRDLVRAQRYYRVDARCPERRNKARNGGHRQQRDRHAANTSRIPRRGTRIAAKQIRRAPAMDAAAPSTIPMIARRSVPASTCRCTIPALAPKRHANADLLRLPRHRIRDHAVDAERGQQQPKGCK